MTRTNLVVGLDFRRPEYRRETFLRFYEFHLRYRAHPGGVYYLMPWLAAERDWTLEQRLWFAFINGNTQNPLTTMRLMEAAPSLDDVDALLRFFKAHYSTLAFDTDRRHHKRSFADSVASYLAFLDGRTQAETYAPLVDAGWSTLWAAVSSIRTFGRLSAFSYAEYLRVAGLDVECGSLFLYDWTGSRSHRNGLAIVAGRDDLDWHDSNPEFDGTYTPDDMDLLDATARDLLGEMRDRSVGLDFESDVNLFTLESALCTYKSWHRPNRRYPNVYNDMMADRIRAAERAAERSFDEFWRAREATLPKHLRVEDTPSDPGCVPVKQNWYRTTGQPIMMHRDYECFANPFNDAVDAGRTPGEPT